MLLWSQGKQAANQRRAGGRQKANEFQQHLHRSVGNDGQDWKHLLGTVGEGLIACASMGRLPPRCHHIKKAHLGTPQRVPSGPVH